MGFDNFVVVVVLVDYESFGPYEVIDREVVGLNVAFVLCNLDELLVWPLLLNKMPLISV